METMLFYDSTGFFILLMLKVHYYIPVAYIFVHFRYSVHTAHEVQKYVHRHMKYGQPG